MHDRVEETDAVARIQLVDGAFVAGLTRCEGVALVPPLPRSPQRRPDQLPRWEAIRMKKSAIVTMLVCVVLLASCVATRPMTEAERDYRQLAEQERRAHVINTGH